MLDRRPALALGVLLAAGAFAGCGQADVASLVQDADVRAGGFADGSWSGKSGVDALGATGEVELEIAGGDIVGVRFQVRQPDGSVKDEEYGKVAGQVVVPEMYEKAQRAVAAQQVYASELEELDDLAAVDAVTGASVTYKSFVEAVADALAQARQG
jgi:major membrane immunogen (membrane-anchored lipoprotein)